MGGFFVSNVDFKLHMKKLLREDIKSFSTSRRKLFWLQFSHSAVSVFTDWPLTLPVFQSFLELELGTRALHKLRTLWEIK